MLDQYLKNSANQFAYKLLDHITKAIKQVSNEFSETLYKEAMVNKSDDSIYPSGTRFVYENDSFVVYVIEQPPAIRTIEFVNYERMYQLTSKYQLAFPYVQFYVLFQKIGKKFVYINTAITHTKTSISRLDDLVYVPSLPNIGSIEPPPEKLFVNRNNIKNWKQLTICMSYSDCHDRVNQVNNIVNEFWFSTFSSDLDCFYRSLKWRYPKYFGSMQCWEKQSLKNPLFVMEINYPPALKLLDLLRSYEQEYGSSLAKNISSRIYNNVVNEVVGDIDFRKEVFDWCGVKFDTLLEEFKQDLGFLQKSQRAKIVDLLKRRMENFIYD